MTDAAAGAGEKKRAARTVARWHFNFSIPARVSPYSFTTRIACQLRRIL
jgi:hypothetical protein